MLRPVALVVAVVSMVTGCGAVERMSSEYDGIAGTRIRFAISLQPEEARAVSELVKRFEARTRTGVSFELFTRYRDQSGVTVAVEPAGSGGMEQLLLDEGSNIHLFAQDNGDLADLVANGALQEVPPDIEIDDSVPESMRPKPAADGKRWFLPFRPNVRLTYAHREAFDRAGVEAPRRVEDLEGVARALRDHDPDRRPRVTLSLSDADGGAPAAVTISELVLSFGGNPAQLADPGSVKAFELLQRLFRERLLARESLLAKHDTEIDYLKQGSVLLAQNWSVTSASLEKAGTLGDFYVHRGWQRRHVVGGDVLGIPSGVGGKELKAAVALAEFLMSREAQAFLVERNAWPAIRDDAYDRMRLTDTIKAARQALQDGWHRPTETYWSAVVKAMNEAVHRVVFGDEAPAAVLGELHAELARNHSGYPASR